MQNSLFQAICRMGIFLICVRTIIHFRPQEAYEKYLRLLAGIMILIQLLLPVGKYLLGRGGQEAAEILQQFRQELEQGMEEAVESAAAADDLLEQMTLEEVQRRMEEQAECDSTEGVDLNGSPQEEGTETDRAEQEAETVQDLGQEIETKQRMESGVVPETGLEAEDRITIHMDPVEPVTIRPFSEDEKGNLD